MSRCRYYYVSLCSSNVDIKSIIRVLSELDIEFYYNSNRNSDSYFMVICNSALRAKEFYKKLIEDYVDCKIIISDIHYLDSILNWMYAKYVYVKHIK